MSSSALPVRAADPANGIPTPIQAPECIGDPSSLFFSENVTPAEPPHPTLPIGHYYQIVRYLGDSVSAPVSIDYGHISQSYPWPPFRGVPLTGLTVPEPAASYQRASFPEANPDNSSGFQLHCYDAGSFINTWTFPRLPITGGGAHSIYGYSFYPTQLPSIYDASPGTDFVLQAGIEIPWFQSVLDPDAPAGIVPVGQVNFFAYFLDRRSGKTFALLLGVFDNRYRPSDPTGTGFIAHDVATPFVSTPMVATSKYATVSPYSGTFTGTTWSGLRFFRAHITQDNFRRMLGDVNAYCAANPGMRYCSASAPGAPAYSTAVTDYLITDFGVLHEVFPQGDKANLSMGVHVNGLGAWNFR
ncbi:hypothetical protein DSM104443_00228 [Usitatibacter rugosus]|uniref:Uncharacterized protein n=1 Tax=Usitatibacter rugosus TaxID=2732067 RepID=A0A6M4GPT5_9PROT|nr:hypothetical protein DSM104443_00228 [Usitatibacter rugosus]